MRKGSELSIYARVHFRHTRTFKPKTLWTGGVLKSLKHPLRCTARGGNQEKNAVEWRKLNGKKTNQCPNCGINTMVEWGLTASPACIYFSLDQSRFTFAFTIMKPLHSSIALVDSRYMCVSLYHSLFFTYWTVPLCSWIRLFTLPLPFADYKEKMCVCGLQHWALPPQVISPIYNTVNLYLEYAMTASAKMTLSYH